MFIEPILGKMLASGIEPPARFIVFKEPIIYPSHADNIVHDYKRLRARRSRRKWVDNITSRDVMNWSRYPYWQSMDRAVEASNNNAHGYNHNSFPNQFFHDLEGEQNPRDTILWMAYNLEPTRANHMLPGLVAEYIRRFDTGDRTKTGYDKMLHYVWAAAIAAKYGESTANGLMYAKKLFSLSFSRSRDIRADMYAHFDGLNFLRQVQI